MKIKDYIKELQAKNQEEHIAAHIWCADGRLRIYGGQKITKAGSVTYVGTQDTTLKKKEGLTWLWR